MKKKLTTKQQKWFSLIGAYLVSLGIPLGTCAIVFPPEIVSDTHLSLSASFVVCIIVGVTSFRKQLQNLMTNWGVTFFWLTLGLVSVLLTNFFQEMAIVSWVAFGSNVASVPLFKISENSTAKLKLIADEKLKMEVEQEVKGV